MKSLISKIENLFSNSDPAENQKNATEVEIFKLPTPEERFTKIYLENYWGSNESVSGPGSTILYTENLRKSLAELCREHRIETLFDAPCGDFNWMNQFMELNKKEKKFQYIGGDIVKPLIKKNNEIYKTSEISFIDFDITTSVFPTADLWICRDCFFHLSNDDIIKALINFTQSTIPFILTTTFPECETQEKSDIVSGSFRKINLLAPPFLFPKASLAVIDDWIPPFPKREMRLWSKEQIALSLNELDINSIRKQETFYGLSRNNFT